MSKKVNKVTKSTIKSGSDVLKFLGVESVSRAIEKLTSKTDNRYDFSIKDRKEFSYKMLKENKDKPRLSKNLESIYNKNLEFFKLEQNLIKTQKKRYEVKDKRDIKKARFLNKQHKVKFTEENTHKSNHYYTLKFKNAINGNKTFKYGSNDTKEFEKRAKILKSNLEGEKLKVFEEVKKEFFDRHIENVKNGIDSGFNIKNINNLQLEFFLEMEDII